MVRRQSHFRELQGGAAKLVLPVLEDVGNGQDGQALHGDPAQPGRRCGAIADSGGLASISGATLIEVGMDHRLAEPEPLAVMLTTCEGRVE
jgi:hypothetical protein